MTLLLTYTPLLPELDDPIGDYCRFVLRDGDAYIGLWGYKFWYGPPDTLVQNFEFKDEFRARAVRDALNEECWMVRRLLGKDQLKWD